MGFGVLGPLLVVLAGFAVWFFALRQPGSSATGKSGSSASSSDKGGAASKGKGAAGSAGQNAAAKGWDLDPEGPLHLEGQVVDDSGAPVGDALVIIDVSPLRFTRTQADGSFQFDKLISRTFMLRARSGTLTGSLSYKLTSDSDPVVLRLRQGATVEVTVQDQQGQPIRGAQVRGFDHSFDEPEAPGAEIPRFITDEQGKARVTGVDAGWSMVVAEAQGYAEGNSPVMLNQLGFNSSEVARAVTITLTRGFAVTGKVVDDKGAPVAGASVVCRTDRWQDRTSSDARGEFRFKAVAPGSYSFAANDGEHARGETASVLVGEGALGGVVITMAAGGSVRGTVVTRDGAEVPYAEVRLVLANEGIYAQKVIDSIRRVVSDARGHFELRGLPRERLQLSAEGEVATSPIVETSLVEVARRDDVRLVLAVDGVISGVVVDEKGEPVPEVLVQSSPEVGAGATRGPIGLSGDRAATLSDGSGAFTLRGLAEGGHQVWAARNEDHSPDGMRRRDTVARTGDRDVRLLLATPGRIVGRLLLDGKPPASASVLVTGKGGVPARAGAFVVGDLEPGTYELRVRGPDFAEQMREDLVVVPGRDTDAGTIELAGGRRLTGLVLDAARRPVVGAKVRAGIHLLPFDDEPFAESGVLPGVQIALTDAQGAFELRGLSNHPQRVDASHASGRASAVEVPGGEKDPPPMTLQINGFGSIRGVVRVQGKPTSAMNLMVESESGAPGSAFATSGPDGSYLLTQVTAGQHKVKAVRSGDMVSDDSGIAVTVVAGQTATVDFDLEGGELTLLTPLTPLPGASFDAAQMALFKGTVELTNAKKMREHIRSPGAVSVTFWMAGFPTPLAFTGLAPGSYTVCAQPITGMRKDPSMMMRIFENMEAVAVYCKPVQLAATPATQRLPMQLPSMKPLPPATSPPPPR